MKYNQSKPRMDSIYRILILSLLNDKPRSGYDLIQSIGGILGSNPSQGKIYPFLHDLKTRNLIIEEDAECQNRNKTIYTLSDLGKDFFVEVLGSLENIITNFLVNCVQCGLNYYSAQSHLTLDKEHFCCKHCKMAYLIQKETNQI